MHATELLAAVVEAAKGPDTALDTGVLLPNGANVSLVEHNERLVQITFTNGDVLLVKAWFPEGEYRPLPK